MGRFLNYAYIDNGLRDHRKFIRLLGHDDGEMAFNAWIRLVLWAHKNADPHKPAEAGVIDPAVAKHILGGEWERYIDLLSEVVLLDPMLDGTWQLHDFAEHQDLAGWARRQDASVKGGRASAASRSAAQGSTQGSTLGSTGGSSQGSTHQLNPTQPNSTHTEGQNTRPAAAVEESEFEEFWKLYPRKEGRGAARRKWPVSRRKAAQSDIIGGLRSYVARLEREQTEARFIAHPTTWLNQERWADEDIGSFNDANRRVTSWGKEL